MVQYTADLPHVNLVYSAVFLMSKDFEILLADVPAVTPQKDRPHAVVAKFDLKPLLPPCTHTVCNPSRAEGEY